MTNNEEGKFPGIPEVFGAWLKHERMLQMLDCDHRMRFSRYELHHGDKLAVLVCEKCGLEERNRVNNDQQ